MNFAKKLLGGLVLGSVMLSAYAQTPADQPDQAHDFSAIQKQLQTMIPGLDHFDIQPTGIKGLYQVILGVDVVYMSEDGQFLVQGDLIDLQNKVNLTRQVSMQQRIKALAGIPEASMWIYPGDEKAQRKATITVFTDIHCPYCRKLHLEVPELNKAGVTVRYLAYPRAGAASQSYTDAVSVWCADKPLEALDQVMKGQKVAEKQCDNPIKQHMQLAQFFQVNGTPNILVDDGRLIPGYVPAKELIKEIFTK
ncbi:DsbC family protein [Thiomicrorhabdus sp. 6S3-12]|uniref:DsbC family protein n=1 Tax=Thiomicrorhabdus sp. 6S3-12 TaxID=2819681 RepID=UPI001AADD451|nr:DsbC family protein [Thiomicrorhabdus sp. 6S3-12]